MTTIIVKKFEPHYNKSLGKAISSRRQYNEEMKRQGMVPQEQGDDMARRAQEKSRKPYVIGKDTERFISEVRMQAKDGKVKLESRAIDFMKQKGVKFGKAEYKGMEGGFDNAE